VDDRLRPLWDFDDLDASEARLRNQLQEERSDAGRAEVLTQLARVAGLRGDFTAGDELIDEAAELAGDNEVALARIELERGRLQRSSGDKDAAFPLFESAFARACTATQDFMAGDAAHMAALAAPDRAGFEAWTSRGIELAEEREAAAYWAGPLLNNLGWEYYDAGDLEPALDAFQRALRARERDPAHPAAIELALYAVGKTLRALGRAQEAVPLLERAVDSAARRKAPDGWLHEELAEEYAALARIDDAGEQARLALPLLEANDPSFGDDARRAGRVRTLAGSQADAVSASSRSTSEASTANVSSTGSGSARSTPAARRTSRG
jgi:tetratricopeptide (TPR) repeat protein